MIELEWNDVDPDGDDWVDLVGVPDDSLRSTDEAVFRMTRSKREARLELLMADADRIFEDTVRTCITDDNRTVAGVVGLFSGGNDSTTVCHMFRDRVTHYGHANTTIGLESTRQFVRDTSAAFGRPLLERRPPRFEDHYRAIVLDKGYTSRGRPRGGFPGPAKHNIMWNRLKERGLEQIRNELVTNPYQERVVFVAGRRRAESQRRANIPENGRKGSIVWISPLINWTKADLNTYRLVDGNVPRNVTADTIHMSGECLCAAYCAPGEREQLEAFYPEDDAIAMIRELEAELLKPEYDHIPIWRKTWGWVAIPHLKAMAGSDETTPNSDGLCATCDDKYAALFGAPDA